MDFIIKQSPAMWSLQGTSCFLNFGSYATKLKHMIILAFWFYKGFLRSNSLALSDDSSFPSM